MCYLRVGVSFLRLTDGDVRNGEETLAQSTLGEIYSVFGNSSSA